MVQITTADAVWEKVFDRELFEYNEDSEFKINFIFDERQALADSEEEKRSELDSQKTRNDEIQEIVFELQNEHKKLGDSYKEKISEYEINLTGYNQKVQTLNDHGGAPPEEFEKLENQKENLNNEAVGLSQLSKELNKLAIEINRLGEKGNSLVLDYNQEVDDYNHEYGFTREFTQGDYQGDKINIYKFSSDNELTAVLAHEFGHALGLDHVDGTSSVMYYLMEETDKSPFLSQNDRFAFIKECGSGEEFLNKLRKTIREILVKFK